MYLEKPPLVYWIIAVFYKIFGVHDWAAHIPIALSVMALSWLTAAFGTLAFGRRAGLYAGVCTATCVGLFLFTRILIPDVMLTFAVTLAMWAFLRALDEQEAHPRWWAFLLAASLGTGLLLKSLIAIVFPIASACIYLFFNEAAFPPTYLAADSAYQRSVHHPAHRGLCTFWPRYAILLIFISLCTAGRANITAFCGFISSTSGFCAFSTSVTRGITIPCRGCGSGSFT